MKKRNIFLIILTFILVIIGVAFFRNIEKQKKQNSYAAKVILSNMPVPPLGELKYNANELKQIYCAQTPYKILSVDLDTMLAVLEINAPRDISLKQEETELQKIEVPVEHKDGIYRLIHTEESGRLLGDREFESANPDMLSNKNLFEMLPETFWFASGAGGWSTDITINPDGTFTGMHYDGDMGDTGDKYPNGTYYICNFNGKFSQPKPINEYIYLMRLEYVEADEEPNIITYEDGIRHITSYPYGLDEGDEFFIYMPNTPISCLPETFMVWCETRGRVRLTLPSNYYGIYNINGMQGFNGRKGPRPACYSDYEYVYENRKSSLWPSDCYDSSLVFWPENGAAMINLKFAWTYDEQREFEAVEAFDHNGNNGAYHISINYNDDYSQAVITVTSENGIDLSPWGGTTDGTLTAVYKKEER